MRPAVTVDARGRAARATIVDPGVADPPGEQRQRPVDRLLDRDRPHLARRRAGRSRAALWVIAPIRSVTPTISRRFPRASSGWPASSSRPPVSA